MLLRNTFRLASSKQEISNVKLLLTSGGITERDKRFLILSERQHINSALSGVFWYCDHSYYGLLRERGSMCFGNDSFNTNKMQLFRKAMTSSKRSAFERCAG